MRTVLQYSSMYLKVSCAASSLVLRPFPFAGALFGVLKNDSAAALSGGVPSLDTGRTMPWEPAALESPRGASDALVVTGREAPAARRTFAADGLLDRVNRELLREGMPAKSAPTGCREGRQMYSHEGKMRAIELYLRYNQSATVAINELGH